MAEQQVTIVVWQSVLWIRIYWIRIRIQHFKLIRVLMTKNLKNTYEKIFFSWSKIASYYLSRDLHKGHPSYRRSLQPSKDNIKNMKFIPFFLFLWVIFPPGSVSSPDPDPQHWWQYNCLRRNHYLAGDKRRRSWWAWTRWTSWRGRRWGCRGRASRSWRWPATHPAAPCTATGTYPGSPPAALHSPKTIFYKG